MTKEEKLELIQKADTQLDGFESYLDQLYGERGVPFVSMFSASIHIRDLRNDLEMMQEEIEDDEEE